MLLDGTLPAPAAPAGTRDAAATSLAPYVEHVMGFIDPAVIQPFNVVLDAGSGIAGAGRAAAVRPAALPDDAAVLRGRRHVPEPRGQPAHRGEPRRTSPPRSSPSRPTSASPGTATPTAASSSTAAASSSPATSSRRCWPRPFLMKQPGATIIYDVRASYAVKDTVARYGGRALMNRVGHAFIKRRMREEDARLRRRSDRPLLLQGQLLRRQRLHPGAAHPRADVAQGQSLRDLLAPLRERYFISGEINTKVASMAVVPAKLERLAKEYARRTRLRARRHLGRVRRLALQRAGVEHRAAAAPEPRRHDAGDHGAAARRGARHHPRLRSRSRPSGRGAGRRRGSRLERDAPPPGRSRSCRRPPLPHPSRRTAGSPSR